MSVQFSYSNPHPGQVQATYQQRSQHQFGAADSDKSMTDRILEEKTVCYCASFDLASE